METETLSIMLEVAPYWVMVYLVFSFTMSCVTVLFICTVAMRVLTAKRRGMSEDEKREACHLLKQKLDAGDYKVVQLYPEDTVQH